MIAICLISFIGIHFVNFYASRSQHETLKLSENQIFISNSNQDIYVNNVTEPLNLELVQEIQNWEECEDIYPYIKMYLNYDEKTIPIVPYFNENDFSNHTQIEFISSNDKKTYISNDLYTMLLNNNDVSYI